MIAPIYSGAESLSQIEMRVYIESGTYGRLQNVHDQAVMGHMGVTGRDRETEERRTRCISQ